MKTVCNVLLVFSVVLVAALWLCPSPVVADMATLDPANGSELVVRTGLVDVNPVGFTFNQHSNPEPVTIVLMGIGLGAIFVRRRKLQQG